MLLALVVGTVYARDPKVVAAEQAGRLAVAAARADALDKASAGPGTSSYRYLIRLDRDDISQRVNIIAQAAINVGMLSVIKTLQLFKRCVLYMLDESGRGTPQCLAWPHLLTFPFHSCLLFFNVVLETTVLVTRTWFCPLILWPNVK